MAKTSVVVRPTLVRKRTKINSQKVTVIVRPNRLQTALLKDLQKQAASSKPSKAPSSVKASRPAAVNQPKHLRPRKSLKKPQVKYVTADVNHESVMKVAQMRNAGRGKILIIVGNGPSITEMDLPKLRNHPQIEFMSINKPDARIWPTQYWAFFDLSQLRRNEDLWNSYNGTIFNSTAIKRQKSSSMQVKNMGGKGWSRDLTKGLHIGRSSVYAALQIAAWMDFNHVYIVGCDMNPEGLNGKLHFYGNNPDVDPNIRKDRFKNEADHYSYAADVMSAEERSRFTFCSDYNSWPFVDKFNRLSHKKLVEYLLDRHKASE
jgi:hypothetical protein